MWKNKCFTGIFHIKGDPGKRDGPRDQGCRGAGRYLEPGIHREEWFAENWKQK